MLTDPYFPPRALISGASSSITFNTVLAAYHVNVAGGIAVENSRPSQGFKGAGAGDPRFQSSVSYLSQYVPMRDMISLLSISGSVTITINSTLNGGFSYDGANAGVLEWNPQWAPLTPGGGVVYPAFILGHELGHAFNFMQTGYSVQAMRARNEWYPPSSPLAPYNDPEEYYDITQIENPASTFFGQPVRSDHQDHGFNLVTTPIPPGG